MGAPTVVRQLDYRTLRDEVAPAVGSLVARSPRPNDHPPWLAQLLVAQFGRAVLSEEVYPDHYALQRRDSDDLRKLRAGLGVSMFGDCDELRFDLGLRSDVLLLRRSPTSGGVCRSRTCIGRRACPLHDVGQHLVQAHVLTKLFHAALEARCLGAGCCFLAHGRWEDFRNWYAQELGQNGASWSERELLGQIEGDSLLRLLLRLSKRGAAIGLAQENPPDGLLGWLDPDETRVLCRALAARTLSAPLPLPELLGNLARSAVTLERAAGATTEAVVARREALLNVLNTKSWLAEMRAELSRLLEVAGNAVREGAGIALTLR